jgi:hypothetical protein
VDATVLIESTSTVLVLFLFHEFDLAIHEADLPTGHEREPLGFSDDVDNFVSHGWLPHAALRARARQRKTG